MERKSIDQMGTSGMIAFLVIWMLMMLLPGIIEMPLLDRDEPRFSRATVEIMERGDPVVPYFNGEERFDKPPMTYWWMAFHYSLFGQNELGARLHSVISSIGVAVILFLWGRRQFGTLVGLGAAFGWSLCLQNHMQGRLALADMPMILMLVISHWALWQKLNPEEIEENSSRFDPSFWVLYLSMGLGFLAKGPVAILFPLITVIAFSLIFRNKVTISKLQVLPGSLVVLVIVGAWGIPALIMTGGAFWDQGIGVHVYDRGFKSFNERIIIPGFYIPTSFLSLFPVFPLVVLGVWEAIRRRDAMDALLLSWAIGPFLIFSFYATQLIHYTLPAFPALMILAFRVGDRTKWRRFQSLYHWFWILVGGLLVMIWGAIQLLVPSDAPITWVNAGRIVFSGFIMALALVIISLAWIWKAGSSESHPGQIVLAGLVFAGAMVFAGQHGKKWGVSRMVGEQISALPESVVPVAVGYREPSLVFYGGRTWDMSHDDKWYPWKLDPASGAETAYDMNSPIVIKVFEVQMEDYIKGMVSGFENVRGETVPDSLLQDLLAESRDNGTPIAQYLRGINFARMSLVEVAVIFPTPELKSIFINSQTIEDPDEEQTIE